MRAFHLCRVLVGTLVLFEAPRPALGWGPAGHQAIAMVAQQKLNANARAAVQQLLGQGTTLATVATWADDLRTLQNSQKDPTKDPGPLRGNAEALKFNLDWPNNADWHFVNLPLGGTYRDNGAFTSQDDVVQAINRCIGVLESSTDTPNFSRLQALRFLVHLVGDIHQPLHDATGYYTVSGTTPTLITDPPEAAKHPNMNDRGGNSLCYKPPPHGSNNCYPNEVHAYWDTELVHDVAPNATASKLAAALRQKAADPQWTAAHKDALDDPAGSHRKWAEAWATRSVHQANAAFEGIQLGEATATTKKIAWIAVTLPDHYADDQLDRATVQLVAGGLHLAHLLNHIQWAAPPSATLPHPDHIVVVLEENCGFSQIVGASTAPYINGTLIKQGALLTNFHALHHPSQPNYLELFSGSAQGVINDRPPAAQFAGPSLGGVIAKAPGNTLSFVGYAQGLPPGCTGICKDAGDFLARHCPWLYFTDVAQSASVGIPPFPDDFATLPTVAFVIPDRANDMHGFHVGPCQDALVRTGDTWLKNNFGGYAQWATTHNSLLVVTWDEDASSYEMPPPPSAGIRTTPPANKVPLILLGAGVKPGATSDHLYDHLDLLRTIEDIYGLPPIGDAAKATDIGEVWTQ